MELKILFSEDPISKSMNATKKSSSNWHSRKMTKAGLEKLVEYDTAHARSSFQARVKNFFSFCHSNGMIETKPAAKLDGIHVVADENVLALEAKEYEKRPPNIPYVAVAG